MKLWNDGLMGGRAEIDEYEKGGTPWCITYTFMPDELTAILTRFCVKNIKLAGPGAYARTLPNAGFLAFSYVYDSNPYVCGIGKDNLLAYGEI